MTVWIIMLNSTSHACYHYQPSTRRRRRRQNNNRAYYFELCCGILTMIMQTRISSAYIIITPQSKTFTTRHHHHAPFRKVKSSTKISSTLKKQSNDVLSAGRCEKSNIRCWASYDNDAQNSSSSDDEPMKQQKDNIVGDEDYGRLDNNNYNWSAQTMAIALPALAGMMTDPILSMVDTLFVGQLSAPSLMSTTAKSVTSSS